MDKEVKYENITQGGGTTYSYSEIKSDLDFLASKGRVLTIRQGPYRIVLTRSMINELPKFADRWKVK